MTYPLLFLLGSDVEALSVQSDGTILVSLKGNAQIQGTFTQYVHRNDKSRPLKLEDLIQVRQGVRTEANKEEARVDKPLEAGNSTEAERGFY